MIGRRVTPRWAMAGGISGIWAMQASQPTLAKIKEGGVSRQGLCERLHPPSLVANSQLGAGPGSSERGPPRLGRIPLLLSTGHAGPATPALVHPWVVFPVEAVGLGTLSYVTSEVGAGRCIGHRRRGCEESNNYNRPHHRTYRPNSNPHLSLQSGIRELPVPA